MITKNIIISLSAITLMSFQTASYDPNNLIGSWKGEGELGLSVEFYLAADGAYYGKLNDKTDKNYGKIVFKKIMYNQTEKNFSGTLIPADKDITLSVKINFENSSRIKVIAKKFMITRVVYFSKSK
jgi:hypothetical protein